jgi:hypothetical protein
VAVKGAVKGNFGAVKGQKRAVILDQSGREGPGRPGNPANWHSCSKDVELIKKGQIKSEPNTVHIISLQQANSGGMWR